MFQGTKGTAGSLVFRCLVVPDLGKLAGKDPSQVKEGVDRPIAVIAVTAIVIKSRDCYFKVLVERFSRRGGVAKVDGDI
jgi:hypothetical protein